MSFGNLFGTARLNTVEWVLIDWFVAGIWPYLTSVFDHGLVLNLRCLDAWLQPTDFLFFFPSEVNTSRESCSFFYGTKCREGVKHYGTGAHAYTASHSVSLVRAQHTIRRYTRRKRSSSEASSGVPCVNDQECMRVFGGRHVPSPYVKSRSKHSVQQRWSGSKWNADHMRTTVLDQRRPETLPRSSWPRMHVQWQPGAFFGRRGVAPREWIFLVQRHTERHFCTLFLGTVIAELTSGGCKMKKQSRTYFYDFHPWKGTFGWCNLEWRDQKFRNEVFFDTLTKT